MSKIANGGLDRDWVHISLLESIIPHPLKSRWTQQLSSLAFLSIPLAFEALFFPTCMPS